MTFLTTTVVDNLVTAIGKVVTALTGANGWIKEFCTTIGDNEIILFFVGLSLIGVAVGFITRLIHARG